MAKMTKAQEIVLGLADEFVAQGIWDFIDVDAFMLAQVK
jgi:hypothetical protein